MATTDTVLKPDFKSSKKHFIFTEEHDRLRESIGAFVEKELAPHAEEWEEDKYFADWVFPRMGELGFLGLSYPEEYGGQGGDYYCNIVLAEEPTRSGVVFDVHEAERRVQEISDRFGLAVDPAARIEDITVGDGPEATAGSLVSAHYVGVTHEGGEQFDASWDRGDPLEFRLGVGMVIQGWDEGITGMKVGGRRRLTIPSHKAYGERGAGGVIKPGATLVFVVDLVGVR